MDSDLQVSRKKYHVFISFRGEDSCNGFTLRLRTALQQSKIDTFPNDDKLKGGDEISQALLDAIEDSQISVVIFSKKYANSWWCLDELVHILRCMEKKNQVVVPVFYHVTPSNVRKQQGSYADAFAKLEERFQDQIIHKWRAALKVAADLLGWDHIASNTRTDSELIEKIVNDIVGKLNLNMSSSDHLKSLVGIHKSIEDVTSLSSDAPSVGIWGIGGLDSDQLPTSASASRKKYDVFISFRGEDTRKNFTSHLHKALVNEKLETYIDERLVRGDEISQSLLHAIEDSQISVIIFSENYASSSWCLDELLRILYCRETNKQIVLPVFYHADPSDVRWQRGSYAVAFAKQEARFKDKIINKWRTALTTAANLSGWDASTTRNDAELVESVVKGIMGRLNFTSLSDLKGLIGIDKCIEDVKSLLFLSSSHARLIGIWGMGGLGKTTLAHAVFREFRSQFEGQCFLANIREEWERRGSTYLQNKLFTQLLKEDPYKENVQFVKQRLCRKKLLIVLDDLDDLEQYEALVEDRDWLNSDSRVIITSRNKQVFQNVGVDGIYSLEQLSDKEALQLFCLNAFRRNSPLESYREISSKFVNYAKGVPLALKVLGSHLYSKSKKEWESTFNKLKVVPNKKIQDILKISYIGLDCEERNIFLDIACFFQGKSIYFVEEILDDTGGFSDIIRVLVDKSLIIVSYDDKLWMHDLLQEMGWEIARGQCRNEIGKHSRLWVTDDICHILKNNTGTAKIEGIFLEASEIREDINLNATVFKKMHNLRLLKLVVHGEKYKFLLRQGLYFLPDKLRYLKWDDYPWNSFPSSFTAQNLVILDMPSSQLENFRNGFQHLEKLEFVNLKFSKKLTHIPDLCRANLRVLDLEGCTSLVEVPPLRFQQVSNKLTLKEKPTKYFSDVPCESPADTGEMGYKWWPFISFTNYFLDLQGCSNLKTLSNMCGRLEHIRLGSTAIEELHSSICSLRGLVSIDLNDCKCLKSLPSNTVELDSLEYLNLRGCSSLDSLPHELPKSLIGLNLSGTAIEQVHLSSFECLSSLQFLTMNNCTRLVTLPTSICKLKSLKRLSLAFCSKLKSFPEIFEPMHRLEVLYLNGAGIKGLPWSIKKLTGLRKLYLVGCFNLESIPASITLGRRLHHLCLTKCPRLKSFPSFSADVVEVDLHYKHTSKIPDWHTDLTTIYKYSGSDHHYTYLSSGPSLRRLTDSLIQLTFPFCECSEFVQLRMTEPQLEIFYMASASITKHGELIGELDSSRSIFCWQGNEIPQWFGYQSLESSIDIKFNDPYWHNTNFLGFAFCVVFEFDEQPDYNHTYLRIHCQYHFKTTKGVSQKFSWTHENDKEFEDDIIELLDEWDNVFVYYSYEDYHEHNDATWASFKFYIEEVNRKSLATVGNYEVKKCGICMLYSHDEKELPMRKRRKYGLSDRMVRPHHGTADENVKSRFFFSN